MTSERPPLTHSAVSVAVPEVARRLAAAGIQGARAEAELLACEASGRSRESLVIHPEEPLTEEQAARLEELTNRRARREPLAYVLGHGECYSLRFLTTPAAMVPRPETEVLAEAVIARAEGARFAVDVGTGCGVLAVVLARELPALAVLGTDVSLDALGLARRNVRLHGVEGGVLLMAGDLLEPVGRPADIVVANLPYIRTGEFPSLGPEVRDYEPRLALDGGEDGLALIRRLSAQLSDHVCPGGMAALEVGAGQAEEVANLLAVGGLQDIEVVDDYSGIGRVVLGRRRPARRPAGGG
jgi:release factor glutamine methyltransferase